MASWKDVGAWLKRNGTGLVGLAGAVATGNVPAAVATVAGMVSEATGETDPGGALIQLQTNPEAMIRLSEIAQRNEADLRMHQRELLRLDLEDEQKSHTETQATIRAGDSTDDPYVRHTRPLMARQSWYATMAYIIGAEALQGMKVFATGASMELALVLIGPAGAYIGFRTFDKYRTTKLAENIESRR